MKTNAVRILDSLGISYELREYEVDLDDLSAETVAQKVGLPPEQVFKTLVVKGDKRSLTPPVYRTGIILAVIPGNSQLDLKALAKISDNRKVETVPLKEVQPLTGYIRGGVTALACKKDYPVYVDEIIEVFDVISVSAGKRGVQIILAPADYLLAVKGVAEDFLNDYLKNIIYSLPSPPTPKVLR
jgi:Cys-tRNA(Pro)/Cys-tRNA(Cys) deacylase